MPIKTQLRMLQVTASLPSIIDLLPASPTALTTNSDNSYPAGDLSGSLAYFAQTIQNIHGKKIIGDQSPGLMEHSNANIVRRGTNNSGAQNILLEQHDGTNATGLNLALNSTGTAAASTILLQNTGGTGANAIKLETVAAGDILVDSGKDLTLLAAAVVDIDGASSTFDTTGGQTYTAGDDIAMTAADTKSIFIGEGTGATATRFEITHDSGAAANERIVLHNQGGTNVGAAIEIKTAAAGGIKLDSGGLILGEATSGVDLIADGNNGFAILGASGGGGNEIAMLVSSGTTQGALQLQSKGGIDITPAQGSVQVDIGRPSLAQVIVAPKTAVADRKIQVLNTGGEDAKAVELLATAGGIDVRAGKSLVLSGTSATGITFGLSEMTSGLGSEGMAFTTGDAECRTFIGKSIFANNTTVIGAFNALADSISGGSATVFTGSIAATVAPAANVVVGKLSGDNANLIPTVDRGQVQVFLNGQLLVSASNLGGVPGTAQANDYAITANNTLQFQFQLEPGDFLQIQDRS